MSPRARSGLSRGQLFRKLPRGSCRISDPPKIISAVTFIRSIASVRFRAWYHLRKPHLRPCELPQVLLADVDHTKSFCQIMKMGVDYRDLLAW